MVVCGRNGMIKHIANEPGGLSQISRAGPVPLAQHQHNCTATSVAALQEHLLICKLIGYGLLQGMQACLLDAAQEAASMGSIIKTVLDASTAVVHVISAESCAIVKREQHSAWLTARGMIIASPDC